jgi:uncharacterized RDD family membrane protein YckC
MSVCQICQTTNADGARYCVRCGSQLDAAAATDATSIFRRESPAESVERAEDLNLQAIQAVARDEIPDALELVGRALEIDPSHVPSIRTRVDILRRIGLTTQASIEEAKIGDLEVGGRVYAGFWQRFLAAFLDGIFALLLTLVPGIIVGAIIYLLVVPDSPTNVEEEDALTTAVYGWYAVSGIVTFLYQWIGNARGGTWGKRAIGLRVVSAQTGEPIGLGKSFVRYLVALVGAGFFYLGWLWMLWDKDKQTWHDKAAGSIVVKAPGP